jgi:hypothetical protein
VLFIIHSRREVAADYARLILQREAERKKREAEEKAREDERKRLEKEAANAKKRKKKKSS